MNTSIQILLIIALTINIGFTIVAQLLISRIRVKAKGRLVSSRNRLAGNRQSSYSIQDLKDYQELLTDDEEIKEVKRAILLRRISLYLMISWVVAGIIYIVYTVTSVS